MSKMTRILLPASVALLAGVSLAELPEDGANIHMGVATCAASQCHGSAVPRDGSNVLQNAYATWTQDDPHSRAYEVLSNTQAKRIAARLAWVQPQKQKSVSIATQTTYLKMVVVSGFIFPTVLAANRATAAQSSGSRLITTHRTLDTMPTCQPVCLQLTM